MKVEVETTYVNFSFCCVPENKLWIELKISEEKSVDVEILESSLLDGELY